MLIKNSKKLLTERTNKEIEIIEFKYKEKKNNEELRLYIKEKEFEWENRIVAFEKIIKDVNSNKSINFIMI